MPASRRAKEAKPQAIAGRIPTVDSRSGSPEHRLVGGMLASVLDVTGRNTVKAVVEYLGGLVHVDLPLELIDKALRITEIFGDLQAVLIANLD